MTRRRDQCAWRESAAPTDDSGGIYGYYDFVAAFKDPKDERHAGAVAWLGKTFDLARFDLVRANKRLAAAFRPVAKRAVKAKRKKS